jgi:hypothetical protein
MTRMERFIRACAPKCFSTEACLRAKVLPTRKACGAALQHAGVRICVRQKVIRAISGQILSFLNFKRALCPSLRCND